MIRGRVAVGLMLMFRNSEALVCVMRSGVVIVADGCCVLLRMKTPDLGRNTLLYRPGSTGGCCLESSIVLK
jgi:hypothetical protein